MEYKIDQYIQLPEGNDNKITPYLIDSMSEEVENSEKASSSINMKSEMKQYKMMK